MSCNHEAPRKKSAQEHPMSDAKQGKKCYACLDSKTFFVFFSDRNNALDRLLSSGNMTTRTHLRSTHLATFCTLVKREREIRTSEPYKDARDSTWNNHSSYFLTHGFLLLSRCYAGNCVHLDAYGFSLRHGCELDSEKKEKKREKRDSSLLLCCRALFLGLLNSFAQYLHSSMWNFFEISANKGTP